MRGNLLLLNLLLAALAVAAGWRLYVQHQRNLRRQAEFFHSPVPAPPAPALALPSPPAQISSVNYLAIAQKLPFSKDRNPDVIIEVTAPKPVPPLPRYYGMMNFGAGPRVILAPASGAGQKSFTAGDKVGEFKLASIEETGLVFEWEGTKINATYEELKDRGAPPQQPPAPAAASVPMAAPGASAPAPASAVQTVSQVTAVSPSDLSRPGIETGEGLRACQPGDPTPNGAVVDGYRKVVLNTPFGKSCRWEKVN